MNAEPKRVRVRFVQTVADPANCYRAGREYDLPPEQAEKFGDLCEPVKSPAKKEPK